VEENLVENSRIQGELLLKGLKEIKSDLVKEVRGRGLMVGLEFSESARRKIAWEFCLRLIKKGILAKTTHEVTVRFTPPLIIKKDEIERAVEIII
jgi:ornithine--oxo-acid transaminase